MRPSSVHSFAGHVWAFNAVGWVGIYFFTGLPSALILGLLCAIPMVTSWWRAHH